MTKFQNKYRIESNRLKNWDYSGNGMYFITIVTQHRICYLGRIENKKMILSDFGKIIETEWNKSFDIRKELFLDSFVIMPNHIHAIVVLGNSRDRNAGLYGMIFDLLVETDGRQLVETDGRLLVEAHGRAPLPINRRAPLPINRRAPLPINNRAPLPINGDPHRLPKSISSFLAGFKSAVNSKIDDYIDEHQLNIPKFNRKNHFFQANYYDHIIRNENSLKRIRRYIINNPKKWEEGD